MIKATIRWRRSGDSSGDRSYSRFHTWEFDGGARVPASSSPDIVPVPMSDPTAVDPEEAFVASLSSCHMLWFLAIAAKAGFEVQLYRDHATGEIRKNDAGKLSIAEVTLRPVATWADDSEPSSTQLAQMHQDAHAECFIANSVKADIRISL